MHIPEILSPAGNMECLKAAVQNGADAVYFGGKRFGARMNAQNFDIDGIREAVRYARLRHVRCYVTINTLCRDRDFKELTDYVTKLCGIGVDALIIQDLGAFELIRRISPQMPIHASTQMTVHNLNGAVRLKELGFSRVILSRELSAENIELISRESGIETEIFAHGALCLSYSGQCLMSSMIGGRSGNSGLCAGTCRLPYSVNGTSQKKYYLSLKDLCLLEHLPKILDTGVKCLKIEGRMKGPEYVALMTRVYRDYLDSGKSAVKQEDLDLINKIFYRGGYTDAYFTGRKNNMFSLNKPDNPYENENASILPEIRKTYENTENIKHKISVYCKIKEGQNPEIELRYKDYFVKFRLDILPEKAVSRSLSESDVRQSIEKTGGTVFEIESIVVDMDLGLNLPLKALNELRRSGLSALEEEITKSPEYSVFELEPHKFIPREKTTLLYTARVQTFEQYAAIKHLPFERIYIPYEEIIRNKSSLGECARITAELPAIETDDEKVKLSELKELGVTSLALQNIGQFTDEKFRLYGSFRLNITNTYSAKFYAETADAVTLSPELTLPQIRDISKYVKAEFIVYGRIPLMISENCVIKSASNCRCNDVNYLIDRMGVKFPVIKEGRTGACRSVIVNSKPIVMYDRFREISESGLAFACLYFTVEKTEECVEISEKYFNYGSYTKIIEREFTRGHFYK